jgi:flagellin
MSKTALGISGGATAEAINPISSATGIYGDATTGMLSLDAQKVADVSALIENVNVAVTPTFTAKKAHGDITAGTNLTKGGTAKEHTFKAAAVSAVAGDTGKNAVAGKVTIAGTVIETTVFVANGGTDDSATPPKYGATAVQIHNQIALQINSSEAMQAAGISATVDGTDGVVLAFADVYSALQRDSAASAYAAKINDDPTFLAKGILAVAQTDAAVLGSSATSNTGTAQSLVFTGSAGKLNGLTNLAGARFEVVGTDANGIAMSEMVIGGNSATAQTVQDFLTVTKITQIGTTDAGSLVSIGTATDIDGVKDATLTAAGIIQFGQSSTNTMVNARVELLHGADDMSTAAKARHAVTVLDGAIKSVNTQRSELGAVSNRLSHTVNNLTNISSNLSAARGGIEDADFAHETTSLAKNQILQQASTAMLAQANAAKQNVLSLLQG